MDMNQDDQTTPVMPQDGENMDEGTTPVVPTPEEGMGEEEVAGEEMPADDASGEVM